MFTEENRGATIIAHNFRGFDGLFILKYMLDNNLKVKVIKRGSQILDFQYKALQMNARDTLNFCALRLADFPTAVGLDHLTQKGDFPHLANIPENWDKIIPFSAPALYGIESTKKSKKEEFLKWHAEEEVRCGGVFDFRKQIVT